MIDSAAPLVARRLTVVSLALSVALLPSAVTRTRIAAGPRRRR